MKKLLLLPLMLLLTVACSTDTDEIMTSEQKINAASTEKPDRVFPNPPIGACYSSLSAHIENIGGLNPIWHFVADIPTPVASGQAFQVYLEYQATDCEDYTTGTGTIYSLYGEIFTNPNSVLPYVEALPAELLSCYRWRLKIYGVSGKKLNPTINCTQYTPWYDSPVN